MNRPRTTLQYLLFTFGILLSPPLLLLLLFVPSTPVSSVGAFYLLGYFLIAAGLFHALWNIRRAVWVTVSGGVLLMVILAIRFNSPPSGSRLHMITLPSGSDIRVLNRIFDERDAVLFGARVGPYLGMITFNEKESLVPTFSGVYQDMQAQGATPLSPFLATYLNQQSADHFDVVVFEPEPAASTESAIIFLHGFGGNFTVQCWLVAKPGQAINALTVCPSTGVSGNWWSPQGEEILQETITYVRQRGYGRIYLAGLSNGAIGISRLAEKYESDIAGLILISGADPSATITDLPVLVLTGDSDERIPISIMEAYVSAAEGHVTYHPFAGDHFLLLKKADEAQQSIAEWLMSQEAEHRK